MKRAGFVGLGLLALAACETSAGGAGGATGSGGAVGTGGGTPSSHGMTCSITADCTGSATCCDGSSQSCDGTRLPRGDGTNAGQFVVSGDGLTVTDTITGLMWQRDGSGDRCYGLACTWSGAKAYCAALTLGGLLGWRLPAVMELDTTVDYAVTSGARIDATAFPGTPAEGFWTSSPCARSSGLAWLVNFGNGDSYGRAVGDYDRVRCVR